MSDTSKKDDCSSWLEISSAALGNNIATFRKIAKDRFQVGVVLKGNAYGHGLEQVLPSVHSAVDCIYLISPNDAFRVRALEKKQSLPKRRIIVLGAVSLKESLKCIQERIEVVIAGTEWKSYLPTLRKTKGKLLAHIHFDTGLSREGFSEDSILEEIAFLKTKSSPIQIVGFMSHFANTEDVTEQTFALSQVAVFKRVGLKVKKFLNLSSPVEEHLSASAGALILPQAHFSTVRVGIALYGLWPSSEARISTKYVLKDLPNLMPVLTWKCKSQIIKWIKKGSYVGYGCTHLCSRKTRIAVLPVGYFDGYPRLVSGKAHVIVQAKRCPILGRVMMNHIIVDITQIDSDDSVIEAILLGHEGNETVSAELLASWAQTINYEIVTRIGAHLPRVVV